MQLPIPATEDFQIFTFEPIHPVNKLTPTQSLTLEWSSKPQFFSQHDISQYRGGNGANLDFTISRDSTDDLSLSL